MADPREPPLFLDQTLFETGAPLMNELHPPPPPTYLKVWIRPCDFRAHAYSANIALSSLARATIFFSRAIYRSGHGPFAFVINTAYRVA